MGSASRVESELWERAATGDEAAVRRLLLPHIAPVSRWIAGKFPRLGRGSTSVEDVVQEALTDACRQLDQFQPGGSGSLRTWLTVIAERRARDHLRREERLKRGGNHNRIGPTADAHSSTLDVLDVLAEAGPTASSSAARHEAVQAVRDAVDVLPEDYRRAVQLRFLDGRRLEDVAAMMQRTPRAVQGLIDRAKKKLQDELKRLSRFE